MRKARDLKSKAEAETAERERAWYEAKYNGKAEIDRLADEAREKAKFEARASNNTNIANRAVV